MVEPKRAHPSGWSNNIARRAANAYGSSASGSQWAQPASSTPYRPPLPLTAIRLKHASHGHSQRGYQGDAVYHDPKTCACGRVACRHEVYLSHGGRAPFHLLEKAVPAKYCACSGRSSSSSRRRRCRPLSRAWGKRFWIISARYKARTSNCTSPWTSLN